MPPKKEFTNKAYIVNKLKNLITRIKVIENFANEITIENPPIESQIKTRVTSINNLYDEYENILDKLFSIEDTPAIEDASEVDQTIEILVQSVESIYHDTLCKLSALMPSESKYEDTEIQKIHTIKLPDVNIPVFDGKQAEWLAFKETFTAVIHLNPKINDVIKFTYLLDKLKGEAKHTIGHISLSDAGYVKAWKDLLDRYDNKRQIIDIHIDGILNLPFVYKDNCLELRKLLNQCNSHISSLESLQIKIDSLSEMFIINSVTRKIDSNLKKDWETELKLDELPTWSQLQGFLSKKCRVLESVESQRKGNNKPNSNINNKQATTKSNQSTFVISNSSESSNPNNSSTFNRCIFCKMNFHPFYLCEEFKKMSVEERFKKIKERKLCFNCFSSKHTVKNCPKGSCKHCSQKHNTLLHRNETPTVSSAEINVNGTDNVVLMSHQLFHKQSLFPTAIILIQDQIGKWHKCRALLDSASDANFISKEFFQSFKFNNQVIKNAVITSLNDQKTTLHEVINANIKSLSNNFKKNINFSVVPTIVNALPVSDVDISRWTLPSVVKLADPYFNMSRKIDILIGNQLFFEIIQPNQINLKPNLPILQDSVFGWLMVGPYQSNYVNFVTTSDLDVDNSNLNNILNKFWEIESFPSKLMLSDSERFCEDHFSSTHYRDATGRYVVSLPLSDRVKELGDSRTQALKRFSYLEKRLNNNHELKQQYAQFITEYISLNHMERIIETFDNDSPNFYMPHHGVLKPSSSTTKLRVVFDASAKSSSNISLNDVMYIGPKVQENLFSIILRFRKYPIVITADIAKMYRQINIVPAQTKLQRILWRFDENKPIDTYELKTVTYGTSSAPFLATRALRQLVEDESDRFPIAAQVAKEDFYVDDILTGANSIDEAIELQSQLIKLLSSGGFELHKWCSNSKHLLANIPIKDREILQKNQFFESIKTLGLLWEPNKDLFYFNVQPINDNSIPTKRSILADIAKIYDPLGLLAPVTITAKILIQSLWKLQINWDDPVPVDLSKIWITFRTQLPSINDIYFKRCIMPNNPNRIELHGFSDSSERAYGACVYLKCNYNDKLPYVSLVCSKTRVAPLKLVSLPRLELCAALLLSRLVSTVKNSLKLTFDQIVLWSDSTITLQWITIAPYKLKTFVANRVNEIQELTDDCHWKHIVSKNNPADVISRGILPKDLKNLHSWWNGPEFMTSTEKTGNLNEPIDSISDKTVLELKPEINHSFVTKFNDFSLFQKYSSLEKLIRVTAYCIRFYRNIKNKSNQALGELSKDEVNNSLLSLVKIVQDIEFHKEIKQIRLNGTVSRDSKIKNLTPFVDNHGLLRVGGRLSNSEYNNDVKHQLLLPYKHSFTELIVRNEHLENFHAGPQLLMSLIRQRFWPIKLKILAKQIVRNCVTCFKIKPRLLYQLMGDLPLERTKPSKPFNTSGVDLCGPFFIKNKHHRKGPTFKVYVATFICFVTKAVHLEIVSDLSSKAFLASLKRFLYRRGSCSTIWSDNATNFVGCNNELKKQKQFLSELNIDRKILQYCSSKQIDWKFIPPAAPNFGGLWESSVKSLKYHLKRVTKSMIFFYEELNTLIIQIEGIMNSRPLSPMSSDPSDPEPLTPAHFLTGGSIVAPPETQYENIASNRLSSYKRLEQLVQSFWKRFSIEYVHTLQQRNKWKDSIPNIKINDVVLTLLDSSQPTHWVMGRVTEIISGKDGKVRVVGIKTKNGNFRRSITKICKFPFEN